jgi:hypothetical protein
MNEAADMKLKAIPHEEVIRRLEELKAGLPNSGQFETVKVELPDVSELRR